MVFGRRIDYKKIFVYVKYLTGHIGMEKVFIPVKEIFFMLLIFSRLLFLKFPLMEKYGKQSFFPLLSC
jgi:hypothetical protein